MSQSMTKCSRQTTSKRVWKAELIPSDVARPTPRRPTTAPTAPPDCSHILLTRTLTTSLHSSSSSLGLMTQHWGGVSVVHSAETPPQSPLTSPSISALTPGWPPKQTGTSEHTAHMSRAWQGIREIPYMTIPSVPSRFC